MERQARRRKVIFMIFIVILAVAGAFFYKKTIAVSESKSIIEESMINGDETEGKVVFSTVKIGSFVNFDAARDFIIKHNIKKFNIYRENEEIYINLGKIKDIKKALSLKEKFLSEGYPAIVEKYSPHKDFVSDLKIKDKNKEKLQENKENEKNKKDEATETSVLKNVVNNETVEKNKKTEKNIAKNDNNLKNEKKLKEFWTIQVGALDTIKSATLLKNKLRFHGIESDVVKEGKYYKVWVGKFETKAQAKKYSEKIDKKIVPGIYIKKVVNK
jgi:cell division septation protein DedD